jgi:hypothetical protein
VVPAVLGALFHTQVYAAMHSGTDLFARLAMVSAHIRKKAFQIFTPNYLPSLFHAHHSGAPLDNPSLAVVFSTAVEEAFRESVVFISGWEYRGEQ